MPLISVIIACRNDVKHLPTAIDSVMGQEGFEDYEIVVADGASTDGTTQYLKTLSDPRIIWKSEPDGGLTPAWNKAIQMSRGDWIIFLGADDYIWDRHVFANAAPYLRSHCDVPFLFGDVCIVAEQDNTVVNKVSLGVSQLIAILKSPHGLGLPHQGFFHNRKVFKERLFDASFRLTADYEFISRYTQESDFFRIPTGPVAAFRRGGISTDPWASIEIYKEWRRIHRMHGRSSLFIWQYLLKGYIKLLLRMVTGKKLARGFVNLSRRMRNLPVYGS